MASISLKYKSKQGTLTAPGDVDLGAMIPIATANGTGSSGVITFSSIPQNYEHLQLRMSVRSTSSVAADYIKLQYNSDTGANYTYHFLRGNGSVAAATGSGNVSTNYLEIIANNNYAANVYSPVITDILDYSNTNKYKTHRSLIGVEDNANGLVYLYSGAWMNTNAISTITLTMNGGSFTSASSVALYGIKRAGA